jgi:hypothetical protein
MPSMCVSASQGKPSPRYQIAAGRAGRRQMDHVGLDLSVGEMQRQEVV